MQIVIDIPEEFYEWTKEYWENHPDPKVHSEIDLATLAISRGIILPENSEESHTAMMMAVEALSNSEKPNKWIPVSERLPEFSKEVLTCSNGGFIEIQSLEDSYDGYWEDQKGDWTDFEEVTHWMPLPKPYEEK